MTAPITPSSFALHADMTLRSLLRRRISVGILVILPLAMYFATHDSVGRSVRALVFGITWAVSTTAFFSTIAARQIGPRLRLAGRPGWFLTSTRVSALLALACVLGAGFWALVAIDQPVRSIGAVAVDFAVTAGVAVAFGTAVGALLSREMEGTLVLFFFAGLQAVTNPGDAVAKALPFWSTRELATYAVDGPAAASWTSALVHAAVVVGVCAAFTALVGRRQPRPRTTVRDDG